MQGDVVETKSHINVLREQYNERMEALARPLRRFLVSNKFYPKVFYNENDINNVELGVRAAITNLDQYRGIFVVQDSPDTPIDNYKGIEFRTSLSKSIKAKSDHPQLLFTDQDYSSLGQLPHSEYTEEPSIQFVGTIVYMANGQIFPQQQARMISTTMLATSGILNQTHVLSQQFINGKFVELQNTRLSKESYYDIMSRHPYGLSVRGWGNWSLRFYELLACGRIPVHVHTDDELLFENWINYDDYIVRVRDIRTIREDIETFHSTHFTDDRSLHQHQDKLFKLYRDYLTFPAFCKHFEEYYEKELHE